LRGLVLFGAILLCSVTFSSNAVAGYFPGRPSNASLQTFTGVIVDYGTGNDFGTFGLRIRGTDTSFYIGLPMTMNGSNVTCHDPSLEHSKNCTDWPSAIVLGTTVVTATCWQASTFNPGTAAAEVCDEIDTGSQSQSKKRTASAK